MISKKYGKWLNFGDIFLLKWPIKESVRGIGSNFMPFGVICIMFL